MTGIVTTNVVSWPGVLRAVIVSPWRSTILRQMARPPPVPARALHAQVGIEDEERLAHRLDDVLEVIQRSIILQLPD